MNKTMIAIGALGAVLALLTASMVMGIESTGTEEMNEKIPINDEMEYDLFEEWTDDTELEQDIEEDLEVPDVVDTNPTSPRFQKLVKRSYHFLNKDFIGKYSNWDKLPIVKTIFTANSSAEWMFKALPRINATGEGRIIDRNGDGYPELVIWKHYQRNAVVSSDQMNLTMNAMRNHTEDADLSGLVIYGYSGFTLVYVDRDGDANPEMISLKVSNGFKVDINGDGTPEMVHAFNWYGVTYDRDDDGDWDLQKFNTSIRTVVDINNDRIPELVRYEKANFMRANVRGRQMWDKITASASRGMSFDRDSDGNPSVRKHFSLQGSWMDRDGDCWPEHIRIGIKTSEYHDKDSDGNPEERKQRSVSLYFMDRNDDRNPEFVMISYRMITYIDRNSDGKVDMIKVHIRTFKWIDRNSDGIPERVSRSETTDIRYPQNSRPEEGTRPELEKPKERPEENERDPNKDVPEKRPEQNEDEPDPKNNDRENNESGQLSSRA